jgi:2,3,4,5-tetrahydropyridine-2-carboxylate N-succinyltransferase
VIDDLDCGKSRVAEKINGEWITHQHLKKAIMLSFRLYPMENLAHTVAGTIKLIY